ncbi:uncharacterized protein LOC111108347 [Crassostrea virginica]
MDFQKQMSFILLAIFYVGALSYAATICPPNHVYHPDFYGDSPGRCCVYTSCKPQNYVKVCDVDGGRDACVPCPPDSYLDDPTNSEFLYDCIEKNCAEDTVPIDYPATKFDSSACSKRCSCDTSKGYCGTDPCMCRSVWCSSEETLLQNCTCIRNAMFQSLTTSSPTVQRERTPREQEYVTSPSSPLPATISHTTKVMTVKPRLEEDDTSKNDSNSSSTLWIVVLLLGVMITVSIGAVWYTRQRTPKKSVVYSNVHHNKHTTVHTYNNCNIQVGGPNVMTVQALSDEDSESDISN